MIISYYIFPGLDRRSQLKVTGCKRDRIIDVICGFFKLEVEQVISKSRKRDITVARQLICHFLYEKTNMNLLQIASFIQRDHSTVIYNKDVVKDLCFSDKSYKKRFKLIEGMI